MGYDALFFTVTTPGDTAVTAANPLPVTIAASAAGFVHLEDAVHVTGDGGVQVLAVRSDTASAKSANGDYIPLITDSGGRLWVKTVSTDLLSAAETTNTSAVSYGSGPDAGSRTLVDGSSNPIFLRQVPFLTNDGVNQIVPQKTIESYLTGASTGVGIAASALMGMLDNTAPYATSEGQLGAARISTRRGLIVDGSYQFLNIAAGQATTTVKSGAGLFHSLVLNSAATATNVTTIYDNTAGSGTVIAIPAVTTATVPVSLIFGIRFSTGLTVVTTTANGGNMTFTYE